jgi:hypothetical protein
MRYRIEFLWDPALRGDPHGPVATVSFPSDSEERMWWMSLPTGTVPGSATAVPEEEGS